MLGIDPLLVAEALAEVGGADVDAIEARRVEDRVEILDRLRGLDHRQRDDRVVGVLGVVAAGVEADPGRAEAAVALGRIAAGADEALRLLGAC